MDEKPFHEVRQKQTMHVQDNSYMIFVFLSLMYHGITVLLVHIIPIMSAPTVMGISAGVPDNTLQENTAFSTEPLCRKQGR